MKTIEHQAGVTSAIFLLIMSVLSLLAGLVI